MQTHSINRGRFVTGAVAGLPLVRARATAAPRRVALIGSGWYGKNDLFRLV